MCPILGNQTVTAENRFGISLQQIEAFRYRITHTIRNEQMVCAKWEVEWQDEIQSQKANAFLYEVLANKELLRHVTTRTDLRPIPAQWTHLMKRLQSHKVFHDYIELAHRKF